MGAKTYPSQMEDWLRNKMLATELWGKTKHGVRGGTIPRMLPPSANTLTSDAGEGGNGHRKP